MDAVKPISKRSRKVQLSTGKRKLNRRSVGQAMLLDIAEGVTARVGETFFSSLVTHLAQALQADIAFVGELIPPQASCIRTICAYRDGQIVDNFSYDLKNTPCETVVGREICSYDQVQEKFPEDKGLVRMGIQGYVGAPLFNFAGKALGIVVVLYRHPLKDAALAESLLRIFGARAAAELQRIQAEKALRESETRFRSTLENINLVAVTLDVQGQIVFCNEFLLNLTGWQAEQVVGKNWFEIFTPFNLVIRDVFYHNKTHPGTFPAHYENEIVTRQGERRLIVWNNTVLHDLDGAVMGTASIGQDVTEQRQAEQRAYNQLRRLNALHRMDLVISSSFDLRFTLSVLLGQAIEQLGVNAADILLYNTQAQVLEFSAGQGFLYPRIERSRLLPGEGHAGLAMVQRRTVRFPEQVDDLQKARFADILQEEGFVAYFGTPLIAKGQVKGVLEVYHRTPLDPDQEWVEFLETLATQAAIAIDNAELFESLQRANAELSLAYDAALGGLVEALRLRNNDTGEHTNRVVSQTIQLAQALGVHDAALQDIRRGALLHDIGKFAIPESILLKPGALTDEECAIVRTHPAVAYQLLSKIPRLLPATDIPYCHHEKWDGSGYPRQLKGFAIPRAARIFAVIDVWDALGRDLPYRKAWPKERILEYIHTQRGFHFEPEVVDAFFEVIVKENRKPVG